MFSSIILLFFFSSFFFFNDTATTEIYTLSLHDALPISSTQINLPGRAKRGVMLVISGAVAGEDRKSTRLNSSHVAISYAVFCLKKKKKKKKKKTKQKKKNKKQKKKIKRYKTITHYV